MNVCIAGATGVLGRRVCKALVAAGHAVSALSRSEKNDVLLTSLGVEPRRGDLFNAGDVRSAASGSDVVLHLATAIPTSSRPARREWMLNDRIRTEGTANLLEAAREAGARGYIQQSVLFLYGDRGGEWVDESTPLSADLPEMLTSAVRMEELTTKAAQDGGVAALTLRYGMFYAHDASSTLGMLAAAQAGKLPVIGRGTNYWNPMHVDDAAVAMVRAVDRVGFVEDHVLNVCDNAPILSRELTEFICDQLGATKPRSVPGFLAKLALGADMYRSISASVRCRNERAKEILGWTPSYRSPIEGYKNEIQLWLDGAGR